MDRIFNQERDLNISCMTYRDAEYHAKVIREGVKKNGFFWDFVPNIGPHPPTAQVWDSTLEVKNAS